MTIHSAHNCQIALELGKQGIAIIPCRPDKAPYVKKWPTAGTTDDAAIRDWWRQHPDAIPGIPCGANGLLVVDCDRKNGVDGVVEWEGQCAKNGVYLDGCFSVETPSGGRHYYFRQAVGPPLGNTAGRIAAGIDTRGDGGQVIAPGAMLPDGRCYRALAGALTTTQIIPEGLRIFLAGLERPQLASAPTNDQITSPIQASTAHERAYASKALADEVSKLSAMQLGSGRNQALNNAGLRMGEIIAAGWIERKTVEDALGEASWANGYRNKDGDKAAWATMQSGLTAGMKSPRPPLPISEILDGVREFAAQCKSSFHSIGKPGEANQPRALTSWPMPKPLSSGLRPVAPFDPAFLPDTIAPWVMDIADRMQCPPDFVAASTTVALGSCIGRQIGIRPMPKDDWTVVPNLWGLVVGRPGALKSPAMAEALAALKQLEAKAREEHITALRNYRNAQQEYELRNSATRNAAKKKLDGNPFAEVFFASPDEPEEPKPKRFIASDATYEALGEILLNNPNGVLAFRDELIALLKTLDREEYAAARGFFLTGWNGADGYTFDRIIRGHQHIEAVCISMLGSTQPGRLGAYISRALRGGESDDGLIQRFSLLVWPDQPSAWRNPDRFPNGPLRDRAFQTFNRIATLHTAEIGSIIDPHGRGPYLAFDYEATEIFIAWRTELEARLRSNELHPAIESHLAKYRKLVPALALVNHLTDRGMGSVTAPALKRAIAFSRYLESHAHRAYGAGSQMEATTAKAITARIRKGDLTDGFTLRDVHQRDWSSLTDREQVQAGIDFLVDLDWLAVERIETGGRPKLVYRINPKVPS